MSGSNSEMIFSVEEAAEGGYIARAIGHSIFTEADDLEALREALRDAVRCHFGNQPKTRFLGVDATERGWT
jgi:hypothetical protein